MQEILYIGWEPTAHPMVAAFTIYRATQIGSVHKVYNELPLKNGQPTVLLPKLFISGTGQTVKHLFIKGMAAVKWVND